MRLNPRFLVIAFFIYPNFGFGNSFSRAIEAIKNHDKIMAVKEAARKIKTKGKSLGSWGDPMVKVTAKNFPIKSFKRDQAPMTGIEIGVSQKIPLTSKRALIEESYEISSKATELDAKITERKLIKEFWTLLIKQRKLTEEEKIVKENLLWNNQILKISEKLYSNGKIYQQSLLDLQVRISELEAIHGNKLMEIKELLGLMEFFIGPLAMNFNTSTIPWKVLDQVDDRKTDPNEGKLQKIIEAFQKKEIYNKKTIIPDLNISFGYTFRSNIDGNGDFISVGLSLPIPTSDFKYSTLDSSIYEKNSKVKKLESYKKWKAGKLKKLSFEKEKIENELKIITNKSIKFSENSLSISSKSYGLGKTSYQKLLQSELKLQDLLLKKIKLNSMLLTKKVEYKELAGERLDE